MKEAFIFLGTLFLVHAHSRVYNSEYRNNWRSDGNFNDYFDKMVDNIKVIVKNESLDPMPLEDHVKGISFTDLLGITWHGEIELNHGMLQDLSLLYRAGDATVTYVDHVMDLKLEIAFPDLKLDYDFRAQIMNIGPHGKIEGKIKSLKLFVEITLNTKTLKIHLEQFKIINAGKIDVSVHSVGIPHLLKDAIADVMTTIFHDVIVKLLEKRIRETAEKVLDNMHLASSSESYY